MAKPRGKPFVKGHDPRRIIPTTGRPPAEKCAADILRRVCGEPCPANLQEAMAKAFNIAHPMNIEEAMLRRVVIEACKGDMKAVEFCIERMDGKAVQQIVSEMNHPFVVYLPESAKT